MFYVSTILMIVQKLYPGKSNITFFLIIEYRLDILDYVKVLTKVTLYHSKEINFFWQDNRWKSFYQSSNNKLVQTKICTYDNNILCMILCLLLLKNLNFKLIVYYLSATNSTLTKE